MATRITRIDDMDGSEGAEAINFQLDQLSYEIDLGPRNRAKFLRMIRPFIERAREVEVKEPVRRTVAARAVTRPRVADNLPLHLADTVPASGDRDLIEMARQIQT